MSGWGDDSIYGQARKEGGIVDMFIDDTIGEDKRRAKLNKKKVFTKKQSINPRARSQLISRMERDIQTLKSMEPR
ncbi:hypothetical protein LCGC14_0363130 [marine sediment metagenome]|uniref:Uncharacterized protein n=1 Tax=marine sediment metagenome TaxID=412755 RepID=A0A0F9TQ90_9ZZZZ